MVEWVLPPTARFQSTLPLRGVTDSTFAYEVTVGISIHTPLAGSDLETRLSSSRSMAYFNPHSPCGE